MFVLLSFLGLTSAFRYPSFDIWAVDHGKTYPGQTEYDYRNSVYDANVKKIRAHNRGNNTWAMTVNKFADLTGPEFKRLFVSGGFRKTKRNLRYDLPQGLPASVNWTDVGVVSPVKDQGQCGSCWAFSTTGSAESAWALANNTLVSVSEQQLVDCSVKQGNQGCNGGLMDYAFQYIIDNKGLTSEAAYPYTATGPNTCVASGKPRVLTISSFSDVPVDSEPALLAAIALQPVSIAIEADQSVFQFYKSGVMNQACGTNLDHGVLAVGYGSLGGNDYYIVKNSWGLDWGMRGYILLGRGAKFNPKGQCGIQMAASYPVV